MRIGIIVATVWEVRRFISKMRMIKKNHNIYQAVVGHSDIFLIVSGVGTEKASLAAETLLDFSPEIVFSVGFAGALREGLFAGDLLLDEAQSDKESSRKVLELARSRNVPIHLGSFYTSETVIAKSAQKKEIGKTTGAIAVEMESSAIVNICRKKNVPCCLLRSVSDTVKQDLSGWILKLNPEQPVPELLRTIIKNLFQLPDFFRVYCSFRKAEKNLSEFLLEFCKAQ